MILLPSSGKAQFARWHAPRVLALVGGADGCAMWRVWQPVAELQRQGAPVGAVEWVWNADPRSETLEGRFDALVLPRLSWYERDLAGAERWVARLHAAGKRVWYEVDDDIFSPWILHQHAAPGGLRTLERPDVLEDERRRRIRALALCDGVTVSSQRLATVVRTYTDAPVEVVPNAIDWRWVGRALAAWGRRTVPPLTVGWAGGRRPDDELAPMAWAWGELARRRPGVTFVAQGVAPECVTRAVPPDRLRTTAWLPLDVYPVGLADIDIGCCPLADRPFSRCKTPIKAMEYAAAGAGGRGAAVVASPAVYGRVIEHGRDGYLCETGPQWLEALERLVDDAGERRRLAKRLRRRVASRLTLERNSWRWPAAWTRLWQAGRA